ARSSPRSSPGRRCARRSRADRETQERHMADDRPDAAEVIARIRMTNAQLDRLLLGVGVARLNQPGAVGIWSVKDVISHIAFWERYAVRILQAIRRGETPDTAAEDETEVRNASVVAQYYLQPWSRVLASWHEARDELIEE